jgi:hypothetical protein
MLPPPMLRFVLLAGWRSNLIFALLASLQAEDDTPCDVCHNGDVEDENQILFCDVSVVAVDRSLS